MQANLMAITADPDQKFSALRAVDSENGRATSLEERPWGGSSRLNGFSSAESSEGCSLPVGRVAGRKMGRTHWMRLRTEF